MKTKPVKSSPAKDIRSQLLPKGSKFCIAPSILSADFATLKDDIGKTVKAGSRMIHLDIMDGHFVPNLTFGAPLVKCVQKHFPKLFLDAHLMVENPLGYLEDFTKAGVHLVTIHSEAVPNVKRAVRLIHAAGLFAGISIKPKTSIGVLEPILNELDLILIMSVEPGFGGQKLIPTTLNKVRELRLLRDKKGYPFVIEIDGGIDTKTAPLAMSAGAEVFVAGSAVFPEGKKIQKFRALERSLENA
ncbi:MAG TPA: ribulose-phosphate 3-epimerase [Candidatus Sumerlaeota bacterium]|nr:ribulose-phosphate 3-epimerase [Candidatus Sumerlaeota bacterium]